MRRVYPRKLRRRHLMASLRGRGGGDRRGCLRLPVVQPDLELALELTDLATEIALPRFRDRDFTVTVKPDGSPVTDVDQAVEQALRERLAPAGRPPAVLGGEVCGGGAG